MKPLILSAVTFTVFWAFLIALLILPLRSQPPPTYDPLPASYALGHAPPHSICCCYSFSYQDWPYLECQPTHPGTSPELWVSYNATTQEITHVTVMTPGKQMGDLLLAWGPPMGDRDAGVGHYVYWPGRYAYGYTVAGSQPSPLSDLLQRYGGVLSSYREGTWNATTLVEFIGYDANSQQMTPWRGFRVAIK